MEGLGVAERDEGRDEKGELAAVDVPLDAGIGTECGGGGGGCTGAAAAVSNGVMDHSHTLFGVDAAFSASRADQ